MTSTTRPFSDTTATPADPDRSKAADRGLPSILFVLPASSLHGGIRVVYEIAEGLADRGYATAVASPDPAPAWHDVAVPYHQVNVHDPAALPKADIAVGTFWTTVRPAYEASGGRAIHFCQGFEGVHREYADLLPSIDEAYRLPIPKILVSRHLIPVLEERYGSRCHLIGQFVDHHIFGPGEGRFREAARPLRLGIVGPFGVRSKGIPEALEGVRRAKEAGMEVEVYRASADPMTEEEEALGVTDCFHHGVPTAQMPDFYRNLDAFLHTSHDEEGFPLPPLEAMACGVPVALTTIRSFAVLPDAAVIRYPPEDAAAVPGVLEQLARPERRKALRQAGLAAAAEYRIEKVLDRFEEVLAVENLRTAPTA